MVSFRLKEEKRCLHAHWSEFLLGVGAIFRYKPGITLAFDLKVDSRQRNFEKNYSEVMTLSLNSLTVAKNERLRIIKYLNVGTPDSRARSKEMDYPFG